MAFWIVTDSCSDLPQSYVEKQKDFYVLPLTYEIDGKIFTPTGAPDDTKAFYHSLREGKVATTAQINIHTWKDTFRSLLKEGHEVLCLPLSSGLSGTYGAAVTAKQELDSEFPNNKLFVIDTKAASLGEGLLVHYALTLRNEGADITKVVTWLNENILKLAHWFTVDDLQFLRRGGRVSTASAYIGSILKIKPVLHVDNEGHLVPMEKVQGRKKSLKTLFAKLKESPVDINGQTIFISHGDCYDDAKWLGDMIQKEFNVKEILINYVGPVVGSHSGPGTVALFFLTNQR